MAESLLIERAEYVMDRKLTLDKATRNFFHFWRSSPEVDNRQVLEDCFFWDLHIPVYFENWPQQPGPAHPGIFGDAFPAIFGQLIGRESTLTLHLESTDSDYFDELSLIRDVLAPRHIEYVLLPSRLDPQYPTQFGSLLFEWPLDSLQHIVDHWFMWPQMHIEGFASRESCLAELAALYFQPYNAYTIRRVLTTLEFGFRLWSDDNGLLVLSDKLDEEAVRKRVITPDLDATIRAVIRDVAEGSELKD